MKNDIYDLPDDFIDFAFMPKYEEHISNLKELAEPEDWSYKNSRHSSENPILENYIKYTYNRVAFEKKIAYSKDNKYACFDTGLVTKKQQEPIYIVFCENKLEGIQSYWHFYKFVRKGETEMKSFINIPEMAYYFDDTKKLVYDVRKELVVNVEHIIEDNKSRFPSPYNTMADYNLKNYVEGVIKGAVDRVRRNYKLAVPQYYRNNIQLLIPLCLASPNVADLAIVVEDYGNMYRASTCLTLDMAINNARLLAKPDRDWLQP